MRSSRNSSTSLTPPTIHRGGVAMAASLTDPLAVPADLAGDPVPGADRSPRRPRPRDPGALSHAGPPARGRRGRGGRQRRQAIRLVSLLRLALGFVPPPPPAPAGALASTRGRQWRGRLRRPRSHYLRRSYRPR